PTVSPALIVRSMPSTALTHAGGVQGARKPPAGKYLRTPRSSSNGWMELTARTPRESSAFRGQGSVQQAAVPLPGSAPAHAGTADERHSRRGALPDPVENRGSHTADRDYRVW